MKEENNGASKNKWSRIFRKKWFFPAVYLIVAAILLTVVVWYQNLDNQIPDAQDEQNLTDDFNPDPYDEDAEAVVEQQEVINMPVEKQEKAEIVTKFYDYNAEQKDQEDGLVLYNNRYYQSTGIDITAEEDETFDVLASLSGEVTEVKEDPLLGNIVVLSHENDVMTYYASLGEIDVKTGSNVKQGDKLGTAGKNLFGKENGTHVHFQLRKDEVEVDPEVYFNQPVSKLDDVDTEQEKAKQDEKDSEDVSEDSTESPEELEDLEKELDKKEEETDTDNKDDKEETDDEEENEANESAARSINS